VEQPEEIFQLPRRLVGHGNLIMQRVRGDSMTEAAIADGDLVIVRQQPTAENGEIVAAQLDGTGTAEATVRTLHLADGQAWLMPRNPACRPIPADDATMASGTISSSVPPATPIRKARSRYSPIALPTGQ
jgi:repressor LexA